MTMDCDRVEELLPWLLNGTLENGERRQVLEHLRDCARCRQALADSRTAWETLAWHPPAAALVAHAAGTGSPGGEAEALAVEEHLAECPSCAAEMELVRTSRLLVEDEGEHIAILTPPGPRPRARSGSTPPAPSGLLPAVSPRRGTPAQAGRGWRQAALAASLVGLVALTGWFDSARHLRTLAERSASEGRAGEPDRHEPEHRQPGPPATAGAPAIESVTLMEEIHPSAQRFRGPDGPPPALALAQGPVTLPLRGSRRTSYAQYEIQVKDSKNGLVLALPVSKHQSEAGDDLDEFDINLPRRSLPPGDYVFHLFGRGAAGRTEELATYPLQVR
jgi:anti-sigma factor RsiW